MPFRREEGRLPQQLEQLVGYREIMRATGVSRSTIERAWRGQWKDGEPRLSQPGKLRGRAVWRLADVEAWMEACFHYERAEIRANAATDPEKLAQDKPAPTFEEWAAGLASFQLGSYIPPGDIGELLGTAPKNSSLEWTLSDLFEGVEKLTDCLSLDSSLLLAAAVFPAIRVMLQKQSDRGAKFRDLAVVRDHASDILETEVWLHMSHLLADLRIDQRTRERKS